ncbi:MAG: hypothetical protein QXQ41_03020 [Candidatus Bathyarchaeia archaeon]
MARLRKPVDYISELTSSSIEKRRAIGKLLQASYEGWKRTLALEDFLDFIDIIKRNKADIGAAQFFGKFRAYAFEEYIYSLLQRKAGIPTCMGIFWGEKCLMESGKPYAMEFDVSIGSKIGEFIDPFLVCEAKVELDSARLKIAAASFAILKHRKPEVKCILVYIIKEVDDALLWLVKQWVDAAFQLSPENNQVREFVEYVNGILG